MSPLIVALCYGSATVFSLGILWYFGVKSWWWHALSVAVAFGIGLLPLPEFFESPSGTLAVGWVFVALLFWGLAAPLFSVEHHQPMHWLGRRK